MKSFFIKTEYIFIILISFFLIRCSSFNVIHINKCKNLPQKQGLYYALPQTVITVDVIVERTNKIKGPYANFAEKYLGLKDVIKKNSNSYQLTDVDINSYSERDPSQFYFIELGNNICKKNRMFLLGLDESGLICNVNDNSESISHTHIISKKKKVLEQPDKNFRYLAENNLFEKIDTIIKRVRIDTITVKKRFFKKKIVKKTLEQKAKDAADFLDKIRESRYNLITGFDEVNYQKSTLEYMSKELDKLENEYLTLFTGYTLTEIIKYKFTYMPQKNGNFESTTLFKFSSEKGILNIGDENGEKVNINIDRTADTQVIDVFNTVNEKSKEKKHGLYYRIPEYAKVSVNQGNITKSDTILLISQFGVVEYLPAKKTKVQFYKNSGAIKNITVE
jgi:hypothetical protein